jgi:poly(3-hydroxybutyrate) depolymerase
MSDEITDTQRIEALARSVSVLVVYEGACRVRLESDVAHRVGRKRFRKGCDVAFLRDIVDGLIKGEVVKGIMTGAL